MLKKPNDEPTRLHPQIAHDLRGYLNNLSVATEVVGRGNLDADQAQALEILQRNIKALKHSIDYFSGTIPNQVSSLRNDPDRPRKGARVLVVEDDYFLAESICGYLQDAGCTVIGPVGRIKEALEIILIDDIDCAVIDANIDGEFSLAIIKALCARNVPTTMLTGYDSEAMPPELQTLPFLQKPVDAATLIKQIAILTCSKQ